MLGYHPWNYNLRNGFDVYYHAGPANDDTSWAFMSWFVDNAKTCKFDAGDILGELSAYAITQELISFELGLAEAL